MEQDNTEPTLNDMDDYNNKESPQKRRIINLVILGLLAFGAIYALIKYNFNSVDDYVGTSDKPGMNTARSF